MQASKQAAEARAHAMTSGTRCQRRAAAPWGPAQRTRWRTGAARARAQACVGAQAGVGAGRGEDPSVGACTGAGVEPCPSSVGKAQEPAAAELAMTREALADGGHKTVLTAYRTYVDALIAAAEVAPSGQVDLSFTPPTELTWEVLLTAGMAGHLEGVRAGYNAYLDAAEAVCTAMHLEASSDASSSTCTGGPPPAAVAAEMDCIDEACAAALGAAGDVSLAMQRTQIMLGAVTEGSRAPLSARLLVSLGESLQRHAESARENARGGGTGFDILKSGRGMAAVMGCLCCQPGAQGDALRAEFAALLRGWAEGPGFAGAKEFGAIEVLEGLLDACGAAPRFAVGTRVVCEAGEPMTGTVLAHWWRHPQWDAQDPAAVYQVELEGNGELIFVPLDLDKCIRAA